MGYFYLFKDISFLYLSKKLLPTVIPIIAPSIAPAIKSENEQNWMYIIYHNFIVLVLMLVFLNIFFIFKKRNYYAEIGNEITTVVPLPSSLSIEIVPLWFSIIFLERANPNSTPLAF